MKIFPYVPTKFLRKPTSFLLFVSDVKPAVSLTKKNSLLFIFLVKFSNLEKAFFHLKASVFGINFIPEDKMRTVAKSGRKLLKGCK